MTQYVYVCVYIYIYAVYLYIHMCVYIYHMCPSAYLSIYLSMYLAIYLPIHVHIYVTMCVSISMSPHRPMQMYTDGVQGWRLDVRLGLSLGYIVRLLGFVGFRQGLGLGSGAIEGFGLEVWGWVRGLGRLLILDGHGF